MVINVSAMIIILLLKRYHQSVTCHVMGTNTNVVVAFGEWTYIQQLIHTPESAGLKLKNWWPVMTEKDERSKNKLWQKNKRMNPKNNFKYFRLWIVFISFWKSPFWFKNHTFVYYFYLVQYGPNPLFKMTVQSIWIKIKWTNNYKCMSLSFMRLFKIGCDISCMIDPVVYVNSCAFICQLTDIRVKIVDNTHKMGS